MIMEEFIEDINIKPDNIFLINGNIKICDLG